MNHSTATSEHQGRPRLFYRKVDPGSASQSISFEWNRVAAIASGMPVDLTDGAIRRAGQTWGKKRFYGEGFGGTINFTPKTDRIWVEIHGRVFPAWVVQAEALYRRQSVAQDLQTEGDVPIDPNLLIFTMGYMEVAALKRGGAPFRNFIAAVLGRTESRAG